MNHLKMHSLNKIDENVSKIAQLFPNCVTEAKDENGEITHKIDFDMLKQELSTSIVEGREERYQFTWPDKKQAILTANAPINKTLRPCREESVNFDTTENLYIEGDNLEVLKLLQETYLGKIKMIYIDPPYNTGNDFVYEDDFAQNAEDYIANSGQTDEEGNRLVANTESNGRFHTDWLNMMYPRLKLARDLLSDDGVIFISIDEGEQTNIIKICDEIFGNSNFVDCITWNKRVPKNDNKGIGNIHEYIAVYTKTDTQRKFYMPKDGLEEIYDLLNDMKKRGIPIPDAEKHLKQFYNKKDFDRGITLYCNLDENYEPWGKINVSWPNGDTFGPRYDVIHPVSKKPTKVPDRGWRWSKKSFDEKLDYNNVKKRYDGSYVCGQIWFAKDENTQPSSIKYLKEVDKMLLRSILSLKSDGGMEVETLFNGKSYFPYPKPVSLLRTLISSMEEDDFIILDFFSGSATTAHAVMQLNSEDGGKRKFIMVQLPELTDEKSEAYKAGYKNICEIGKERIRRAGQQILKQFQNDKDKATSDLFAKDNKLVKANSGGGTDSVPSSLDVGFRVLKVDSSNMQDVYYSPDDLHKQDLFQDNVKPDRTAEDLLFQVMLDLGVELSSKITTKEMNGKTVYYVNENYLVACFDQEITEETITQIAKEKPYYFVMRDSGFANDSVATNFEQIFTTYSTETVRKVL